ncbi:MAG: PAS domain S-box protein [Phormidesmis sp.]
MSAYPSVNLSRTELEYFFDLASELMCILDAEGRCQRVNETFENRLGYSYSEMVARPLSALAHPDDVAEVTAQLNKLIKPSEKPSEKCSEPVPEAIVRSPRPSVSFISRYQCKDENWLWLEWNVTLVESAGADGADAASSGISGPDGAMQAKTRRLYCVARDMTERRQLAQEVERAAHRRTEQAEEAVLLYADVVRNMQVGLHIWQQEVAEEPGSLRLLMANPAADKFIGLPADSIVGKPLLEAFPALVGTNIPEIYAGVIRTQQPYDLKEVTYADENVEKSVFTVKAFPLPNRCLGVAFEDVTARKLAEAQRAEQAAQLRVIFDQAGVGIARLAPDGTWIQVNQRLCEMLGYKISEMLETRFTDVTHPADIAADLASYQRLVRGEIAQDTIEKRYLTKQGTTLWTYVVTSTVRDHHTNELLYFIATVEDITARKEALLDLRSQKEDLLTVNIMLTETMAMLEQRNQELDQFAYVTSHDLKSPLRAIANLATWIEEDLGSDLPAENKEQFDLLKNRVHRMEGLINGLLEYSRVGRTHQSHEQIDVDKLLAEVIDSLSPLGEFTIDVAPDMPVLEGKRVPLLQIFLNLVGNALKHSDRPDGHVQVSVRDIGNFYEFAIADDGPGIAEKYHEKIFTIFQTLKSRDDLESTGIGLSLVKKAVTAEGGEIRVVSAVGQGATFYFTWPKQPYRRLTA